MSHADDMRTTHITPVGGNVFSDLGFPPEEAKALQAESRKRIAAAIAIKKSLMGELSLWIEGKALTQADAAKILGVTRPRVSDVVNRKTTKFTIDALVSMLTRTGKRVRLSVG